MHTDTHTDTPLDSDTVLDMDCTELADLVSEGPFTYAPTDDEISALQWISDRYGITGYLCDQIDTDTHPHPTMRIDPFEVSEFLTDEGLDRVPCLSDDTALQRIVWAIGPF